MHIGAGQYKGRRLPEARGARPVGARLKTSLFSVLAADIEGARVLDLCAGVGGFGLEALSRGADVVVLVEHDPAAVEALERWIEACGCGDRARVIRGDALDDSRPEGEAGGFDVVFLDPPFEVWAESDGAQSVARGIAALAPDGLLVLKLPTNFTLPADPRWQILRRTEVGAAAYALLARA